MCRNLKKGADVWRVISQQWREAIVLPTEQSLSIASAVDEVVILHSTIYLEEHEVKDSSAAGHSCRPAASFRFSGESFEVSNTCDLSINTFYGSLFCTNSQGFVHDVSKGHKGFVSYVVRGHSKLGEYCTNSSVSLPSPIPMLPLPGQFILFGSWQ